MTRIVVFYGAIGALIVGAFMVASMLAWPLDSQSGEGMQGGVLVGYLTQIVALTTVFIGIKTFRDKERGGVIKFLPAFLVGLGISAIASLGWVIAWEIVLSVTKLDFGKMMVEMTTQQATANGLTGAELEQKVAEAEEFGKLYMANPLVRVPVTFVEMFPVGAIISLISALLLRNSRFMPARGGAA